MVRDGSLFDELPAGQVDVSSWGERPTLLADGSARSEDQEQFGHNLRSWLIGQPHLFQKFNVTRVSAQASHERIGFKFGGAGISLLKSAVQPLERLLGFLAIGV